MSTALRPFRCRFRLRTLLVAAPVAACLVAWGLREPVKEATVWIVPLYESTQVAADDAVRGKGHSPAPEQADPVARLKSIPLLSKALEPPEISALPIIKEQRNAAEWLRDELQVDVPPGSDVIRLSLRGPDSHQLGRILSSVALTYSRAHPTPIRLTEKTVR